MARNQTTVQTPNSHRDKVGKEIFFSLYIAAIVLQSGTDYDILHVYVAAVFIGSM